MNRSSPVAAMLQFAFGPSAAVATSPNGITAHTSSGVTHKTTAPMLALAAAAAAWWESRRPEGWSLEQHLAAPAAGCDGSEAERALAEAVGQWIRAGT